MNVVKKNAPSKSLLSKRYLTNIRVHIHHGGNSVNSKCDNWDRRVFWSRQEEDSSVVSWEATSEQLTETSWVGSHPCFFPLSTAAVPPPSPLLDHRHTVLPCVFGVSSPREGAPCSKLSGCRQTNSAPISLTDNHHTDRLSAGKSWATSVWFGPTGKDDTTLRGTQTRNQMHAEIKKNY